VAIALNVQDSTNDDASNVERIVLAQLELHAKQAEEGECNADDVALPAQLFTAPDSLLLTAIAKATGVHIRIVVAPSAEERTSDDSTASFEVVAEADDAEDVQCHGYALFIRETVPASECADHVEGSRYFVVVQRRQAVFSGQLPSELGGPEDEPVRETIRETRTVRVPSPPQLIVLERRERSLERREEEIEEREEELDGGKKATKGGLHTCADVQKFAHKLSCPMEAAQVSDESSDNTEETESSPKRYKDKASEKASEKAESESESESVSEESPSTSVTKEVVQERPKMEEVIHASVPSTNDSESPQATPFTPSEGESMSSTSSSSSSESSGEVVPAVTDTATVISASN